MDKSIRASLCKGIRACGLPKRETLSIVNTIERWYDSSGEQWTVDRLKSLHHWYITVQAGQPEPPAWCARHNDCEPKGSFRVVFHINNMQKALAILSCHTVFKAVRPTEMQISKFESATMRVETAPILLPKVPDSWQQLQLPDLVIGTPPFESITGHSIPVLRNQRRQLFNSDPYKKGYELIKAYADSWAAVPQATLDLLSDVGEIGAIPPNMLNWRKLDEHGVPIRSIRKAPEAIIMESAGSIGLIQEPSLKGRWIANPNRIAQWATRPLASHWYDLLRNTKTDCTFSQESGVKWVQDQLRKGVKLAGADMTSASDLLSLESSLRLLCYYRLGRDLNDPNHWSAPVDSKYRRHIEYFKSLSRALWDNPHVKSGVTRWTQGQPLGTAPSFALLGLTNNLLGQLACRKASIPDDSFRVIGDDIIMDSRAFKHYALLVEQMGGEINRSKTIESDKLAEFAGRIITSDQVMLKRVKYKEVSDNSFMALMSHLGDQAKSLLRPRQRAVWETFKYVPGVAVDGPYSDNSFGIPLEYRYEWYLKYSNLSKEKLKPDEDKLGPDQFCNQVWFTLRCVFKDEDLSSVRDRFDSVVPLSLKDDFQSSLANAIVNKSRDPRLGAEGETLLQVLEGISRHKEYTTFVDYISMLQEERQEIRFLMPQSNYELDRTLFLSRLDNAIKAIKLDRKAKAVSKVSKPLDTNDNCITGNPAKDTASNPWVARLNRDSKGLGR